jgi:hypothetical protein
LKRDGGPPKEFFERGVAEELIANERLPVKYSSAQEIKDAINSLLAERGLLQVSLEKLGMNLE